MITAIAGVFAVVSGWAIAAQDKHSKPPQGHDAKCGAACHMQAASKDYIFTPYAKR